jgi:hypothetical protein
MLSVQRWVTVYMSGVRFLQPLRLIQPTVQCVSGALTPEIYQQMRDADHWLPYNAEFQKSGAIPPVLMAWCSVD